MIGKRISKKKFNPTGVWDRRLRDLKYGILGLIILFTWHLGTLVFRAYDPFLAFFHLGKGVTEMPWAYTMLGIVVIGSLWIERFFCKYACPLGAVIGIVAKLGLTKVHRDPTDCKGCNICHKQCHAHVEFLSTTTIRDAECNHCMECVAVCPRPNVLTLGGVSWRFSHPVYASLLVVGLFLMVGTSQVAGKWQTKPAAVSFTDATGKLQPENIRGWMNLEEISIGYGVPLPKLYREAGLPATVPPTARLNTIAEKFNVKFEPESVRAIVQTHLSGAPVSPKQHGDAKSLPGMEPEVKGFMTLNEIALKTGVPKDYLLKSLALPPSIDARAPVRHWMHDHNKSIQDLRDAVTRYRSTSR